MVADRVAHLRSLHSCPHDAWMGRPPRGDLRGVRIFDGHILFLGSELLALWSACLRMSRMLKMAPCFVVGSSKSSTYPGGYACDFSSPAALPGGHFEDPECEWFKKWLNRS